MQIIERLILDHRRMSCLLDLLPEVADAAINGDEHAADRLYCMIDYLSGYPNEVHHPTEDIVFDRLRQAGLSDSQLQDLERNQHEHRALEAATKKLISTANEAENMSLLQSELNTYITHQKQHMEHEESSVFELAREYFSSADWDALQHAYDTLHDPLFDARDARFEVLYQLLDVESAHEMVRKGADATNRFLTATGSE